MKIISENGARASTPVNKISAPTAKHAAMEATIYPEKYRSDYSHKCAERPPVSALRARAGASSILNELEAQNQRREGSAPLNNMGVTKVQNLSCLADDDGMEEVVFQSIGKKGKYEIVRVPKPLAGVSSRSAFVDQVSFTIQVSSLVTRSIAPPYENKPGKWPIADAVPRASSILLHIFGFGVSGQRDRGVNFYKETWLLGTDGEGMLSIGGNGDTCNIQITGQGCQRAAQGWEQRLHEYITAVWGKFSRIDVAADYYEGQYTPQQAEQDYLAGKMNLTNRSPFAKRDGDWYGDGGKTFYVGRRESGKLTRVYEKGKEVLGKIACSQLDVSHRLHGLQCWVRIETEWHGKNRIIPHDVLLRPGEYLAGAHPAFSFINAIQDRVLTTKHKAQATVERVKQNIKRQSGKSLYTLMLLEGPKVVMELLREECAHWAKQYGEMEPVGSDRWWTWEQELSKIPF